MKGPVEIFGKLFCIGCMSLAMLPASAVVRLGDLGPLEVKFFAHQYDRETPAERLARLEKLVFGTVQTGSIEERVEKISKTIDVAVPDKPVASALNKPQSSASPAQPAVESRKQVDASTSDYPRVSELERSLLGRTYVGEPVRQRLSRLETKAYGAPSRVDDLAVRVDKLTSYAGVYGMQPSDLSAATSGNLRGLAGLDSAPQTGSSGMLERVSAMEVKVFGHANLNHSLVQRIRDLETNVLGSAARNPNEDMTTRVNQLWASVKPTNLQTGRGTGTAQTAQTLQPFAASNYAGQSRSYGAAPYSNTPYSAAQGYSDPANATAYNPSAYNASSSPFMASNGTSNNQYGKTQTKHKNKGQHSSFLGKIGKVVAFAGTAAVGAGGLAVGAMGSMGSMNMGYYGMGMGTGLSSSYPTTYPSSYRSYAPSYGSVSSIGSFGSMSTGSMFGSPYNSSYGGSFFSP